MTNKSLLPAQQQLIASAVGNLDAYIYEVNRIPVLTLDEEQSLARRYRDDEDLDAARQMVMAHLRFVVHVAKGYSGYGSAAGRSCPGRQYRPDEGGQAF